MRRGFSVAYVFRGVWDGGAASKAPTPFFPTATEEQKRGSDKDVILLFSLLAFFYHLRHGGEGGCRGVCIRVRTSERRRPDALGKAPRVTAEAEAREAIVCGAVARAKITARGTRKNMHGFCVFF